MELIDTDRITAFIADNKFRKRDVRFSGAGRYKKKVVNWKPRKGKHYFTADDFVFNEITGKYKGVSYMEHIKNSKNCSLRSKCIRNQTTKARQVAKLDLTQLGRKRILYRKNDTKI